MIRNTCLCEGSVPEQGDYCRRCGGTLYPPPAPVEAEDYLLMTLVCLVLLGIIVYVCFLS